MSKNCFESIEKDYFNGLVRLEILHISPCRNKKVNIENFNTLRCLRKFYLYEDQGLFWVMRDIK